MRLNKLKPLDKEFNYPAQKLVIKQITLKQANGFVLGNHRHHSKVVGHKFSIGCFSDSQVVGVVIIGRPISRKLDNGSTLEVTRLCTIGIKNTASKLLASSARIAKEFGYKKIITYILKSEEGISLKAAGWELEYDNCGGLSWNSSGSINRTDKIIDLFGETKKYPNELKQRWCKILAI